MAFSALMSLRYTLMNLDFLNITQSEWDDEFNSLCYMLQRLDDESYRGIDRIEIHALEAKITEAVWKVEDVIESHQISQGIVDEEGVEKEIHSFLEAAKKLREEYERALENSRVAEEDVIAAAVSQTHDDNSTAVGLSDISEQVLRGLLDDKSEDKMLAIWGMAGIGKTHLAHHIYHHPLIVQHFDLRLWVNIGSKHRDIENIFVGILAQIQNKPRDLFKGRNEHELRDLLQSSLLGCGTFFVVFDDVWSPSVLGACLSALEIYPNERSILVTTRLFHATKKMFHIYLSTNQFCKISMPFLSNEESWDLLRKRVFAEKSFPTQLEIAGRKIAEICEGLPLLILTVADILRGLDQTEEFWNKVAEKRTTTFPDAYDRIYKILVSSYDYLPKKYKACFLYMGAFLQSHEILVPKLINLWSVENFPGDDETVEELVFSSLAFVCKRSSNSRIKSCKLHCTYWYVCVTEAKKNELFHVLNKLRDVSIERPRRLSVQNNMLFGLKEVYASMAAATSLTRSLLFSCEDHQYPIQICFNAMLLLKVLDALAIRFYDFPNEVLSLLNLKYLALTHNGELPCSISQLQRLKFLILRRHHNIKLLMQRESTTYLPKEIWDLKELEYLRIMGSNLPDPNRGIELPKLSRLYVNANSCTEGVLRGTPALKKLGIEIELQPECGAENPLRFLEHIWILKRLESLKCVVVNPHLSSDEVVTPPNHPTKLPRSLKKLSLKGLGYSWEYISAIGSLPNLQVLKLRCYAFRGPFWKIKDGEFWRLKYLLLEDIDLVHWIVQGHLPQLKDLIVRHCYKLKIIYFHYIPNLDWIEVDESSHSTVEFALQQIKDSLNPLDLRIVINCSWNL